MMINRKIDERAERHCMAAEATEDADPSPSETPSSCSSHSTIGNTLSNQTLAC
jgi:hypothetical protein